MNNGNDGKCYGCGAPVPDEPGSYYCDTCVAEQLAEHKRELTAFDAYHKWADKITRGK